MINHFMLKISAVIMLSHLFLAWVVVGYISIIHIKTRLVPVFHLPSGALGKSSASDKEMNIISRLQTPHLVYCLSPGEKLKSNEF